MRVSDKTDGDTKLVFDIHSIKRAQETLESFVNDKYSNINKRFTNDFDRNESDFAKELVKEIESRQSIEKLFESLEVVFLHVTTSSDECKGQTDEGLYATQDIVHRKGSELYNFLKENNIYIGESNDFIVYQEIKKKIPKRRLKDNNGIHWALKTKLGNGAYSDGGISGCYYNKGDYPNVSEIPEILSAINAAIYDLYNDDIDLKKSWQANRDSYALKVEVPFKNVHSDKDRSSTEILEYLLEMAIQVAEQTSSCDAQSFLMRISDDIDYVDPDRILETIKYKDLERVANDHC